MSRTCMQIDIGLKTFPSHLHLGIVPLCRGSLPTITKEGEGVGACAAGPGLKYFRENTCYQSSSENVYKTIQNKKKEIRLRLSGLS